MDPGLFFLCRLASTVSYSVAHDLFHSPALLASIIACSPRCSTRKPPAMADQTYGAIQDLLERMIQTGLPLVVRRRCNPYQQSCWAAMRFLIDTLGEPTFGSRDVAREMNTQSYPRVAKVMAFLVDEGLITLRSTEEIPGGLHERGVYAIPWEYILEESIRLAKEELGTERRYRRAPLPSPEQIALPFDDPVSTPIEHDPEASSVLSDSGASNVDESASTIRDQDILAVQPNEEHLLDPMARPRAPDKGALPPAPIPATPSTEIFAAHPQWKFSGRLLAHPLALWSDSCARPTRMDRHVLALLADQHDGPTQGYGWYWVGIAIVTLAGSGQPIPSARSVKNVLDDWQARDAYGTDRARYTAKVAAAASSSEVSAPPDRRNTNGTARPRPRNGDGGRSPSGYPAAQREPGPAPPGSDSAHQPEADLSDDELAAIEHSAARRVTTGRRSIR